MSPLWEILKIACCLATGEPEHKGDTRYATRKRQTERRRSNRIGRNAEPHHRLGTQAPLPPPDSVLS